MSSVTDNFNRANNATVGNDSNGNAWLSSNGSWQIASNALAFTIGSADIDIRDGTTLASPNHYAQADITWPATSADNAGVLVRMSASVRTFYRGEGNAATDTNQIFKVIAGAFTSIASASQTTGAETDTVKLTANGTTLTLVVGTGTPLVVTDSGIDGVTVGGLRTGIGAWNGTAKTFDNFQAADLATLEQEGYRFRNDDGSETTATWLAAQDSDVTAPLTTNLRLRTLVNATDDPASLAYTLCYKKSTDSSYTPVLTAQPSPVMPVATSLTAGSSTSNLTSYPTASVTLTAGRTYVLGVAHSGTASLADPSGVATTGGAITFAKLDTQGYDTAASPAHKLTVWTVKAGSTVTDTITITTGTATGCVWSLIECDANAAGTFGTPNKAAFAASTTATATPGALANSASLQLAFGAHNLNLTTDVASGTGWASLGTGNSYNTPATGLETAQNTSGSASQVTFSTAGSANRAAIAFEVIAATPANVPILVSASANIVAGGEATTAQLTAPSGKTTANFTTGREWDDENGADSIDIASGNYTELEWCLTAVSGTAVNGDVYQFRVYAGTSPLDTYTLTPQWTIGSSGVALPVWFDAIAPARLRQHGLELISY